MYMNYVLDKNVNVLQFMQIVRIKDKDDTKSLFEKRNFKNDRYT